MADITLLNPWGLLALPIAWLLLMVFAWQRRFKPFGPFLLRLVIIVLVALALSRPAQLPAATLDELYTERVVLLVDQSASLGESGQQALRAEAARLTREFPNSITLFFSDQPVMFLPLSPALTRSDTADLEAEAAEPPVPVAVNLESLPLDLEITNLDSALSMGVELLHKQTGRLVLLSDGLPTKGDTLRAMTLVAQQGIPVDVLTLDQATLAGWTGTSNEVRLTNLAVPPVLRQGEPFDIEVTIHSTVATDVTLRLSHMSRDEVLAEDVVAVQPGPNLFTFEATADELGPQTFRATIAADADGYDANNSFWAMTQVYPPPRILVVGNETLPSTQFAVQLEQAGFDVDVISAADLPDHLSDLEAYAGMVLHNVSARSLRLEQMLAVQEFTRSLGRGLLVTGGRDSFSLGNYDDTPLADLIPLTLEPPPREERPPVALLLIIDHSGSMLEEREPATKLAMAKAAAIRATDILGPEDLIGVLIFDNHYEWVVPFQPVSDGAKLLEVQRAIANISGGGGTRILDALEVGLATLAQQESASGGSHAVLFTDGKSFDGDRGLEDYDRVVDMAREANITLSSIAIGSGADQELLAHLAERGLGRYHFAAVPDELPALTIAESDILRSNAVQEGEQYRPSIYAPHPILRGFTNPENPDELPLPDLTGYIAMTPKPRAEIALQTGPGDALLTVWGYGLGRVAAWSSDTGKEWAAQWPVSPEATRFWGQVVGYTLPAPDLGLLQLRAAIEPNGIVTLSADSVTAAGQTVDLARTQATLTTPAGREISLTLRQVSPGHYQQRLHLPDPGAYQLSVTQAHPDNEPDESAAIGFVVPYPAEYNLPEDNEGEQLLRDIAATTGGLTFALGESLPVANCDPQLDGCAADTLPASLRNLAPPIELWPWLLLPALMLWPIEIAWRRWGRLRIQ